MTCVLMYASKFYFIGAPQTFLRRQFFTMSSDPDVIELVACSIEDFKIVSQDACLEIPLVDSSSSYPGPCQVRRSDIDFAIIEYIHLEMNPRAQLSLQFLYQHNRILRVHHRCTKVQASTGQVMHLGPANNLCAGKISRLPAEAQQTKSNIYRHPKKQCCQSLQ